MYEQPSFFDDDDFVVRKDDRIHFGTSSFSSPDWLGSFYPKGTKPVDFLRYYATQFDCVEIDATYYHVPSAATVEAWIRKTDERFTIAAKFPRSIVHGGDSSTPDATRVLQPKATYAVRDEFLEVMSPLGRRLGPLLLQFPHFPASCFGNATEFLERLDRFLTELPPEFQYAVEIRNAEWLDREFENLCRRHRVALTLVDHVRMPHGADAVQQIEPLTAPFAYVRLLGDRHGIEKITKTWRREVVDQGESLQRWAELLVDLYSRSGKIYVFANNHYAGHGPTTIRRLSTMFWSRLEAGS